MKVAIVCDWLTGIGGAERVVLELHKLYPDAPIYTSQYNPKKIDWFDDADVRTGWLQKLPVSLKKFLPILRAWYFSRLKLNEYDLVISSSGAEAKFVKVRPGAKHIAYIHAPTHYYWNRYEEYLAEPGFGKLNWLAKVGLKITVGPMRRWDYKAAQRPDHLIANSKYTCDQIQKFYGRDSNVIHPPVDITRFEEPANEPRRGFVTAGRQTPYKRIDLAVLACTELELPLLVLGSGPEHSKLKKAAGKSVTFLRGKSDEELAHYFQTSLGFIFPGVDDFGIVAVEALAAGTPVIAYGEGGALDYVTPETGVLFQEQTVESLVNVLKSFNHKEFKEAALRAQAAEFSANKFRHNITRLINKFLV